MLALVAMALLAANGFEAHPMHTAVAEISYEARSGTAAIRIRVFVDDFTAALGEGTAFPSDSAMSRYVRGSFALADHSGRPLPISWIGAEREGDVVVLHLQARAPAGLANVKVVSALLSDVFEDQVNIVRASYDGRSTTLLFTRGDPAKALP